jgi:hypothetical protein
MRDSNSRGVAPNTLSNNVGQRSPRSATVRDLPERDGVAAGERLRTEMNETRTETSGLRRCLAERLGAMHAERRGPYKSGSGPIQRSLPLSPSG